MENRVVMTIEELRKLCPNCAEEISKTSLEKGIKVKKVSLKTSDYERLKMNNLVEERISKLKKDIETVMCWRKFGKELSSEQQRFADKVADDMIAMRTEKQLGVQLVSSEHIKFIKKGIIEKGQQPVQGSDAVPPITQDVVATGPADKDNLKKKPVKQKVEVEKLDTSNPQGKANIGESSADSGKEPRKSPDIESIEQNPPEDQRCGEVNAIADSKTDPKQLSPDDKGEIAIEEIGHHPDLPMPIKMAEELIENAKWGIEIGAYTNMKEGIERQLGRKDYAEFVDTKDKLKEVISYLTGMVKETEREPIT